MTFVKNVSTHFKEDFNDIEVMKWNLLHKLILLAQDDYVGLNITLNTKRGPHLVVVVVGVGGAGVVGGRGEVDVAAEGGRVLGRVSLDP